TRESTPAREHVARGGRLGGLPALPSWLLPAGALLLFTALLLPVLHAPFFGDDITNSELAGYLDLSGKSLIGLMVETTRHSVSISGRPQLLIALFGEPLLLVMGGHSVLYHALLLALAVLDAGLLYLLLRRLGLERGLTAVTVVLAAGFMQLRIYHDSFLAYGGLIQILFAFTLGSALAFERYLREGRRRDLWLAFALFAVCPLTYEVTYTFAAVHVGLAFTHRRGRAAIRAAAPFVGLAAVFVVTSWLLRRMAPHGAVTYPVSGGPWMALRTYFIQLFPPLPVTSFAFDPWIGGDPAPGELLGAVWRGLAVAGSIAALSIWTARRRVMATATGGVVALGFALWLAPPALLSLTPKYQTELSPGKGYLPVLIQVFGVAILLTCGLRALLLRAAARSRGALLLAVLVASGLAGFGAGVTAFNNLRVLGILQPERQARSLLEGGVEHGVFAAVPENASVLFWERDVGWSVGVNLIDVPWQTLMLANLTGHRYDARIEYSSKPDVPACPRTQAIAQPDCAELAAHAYWARARLRPDGGTVFVAPTTRGRTFRSGVVAGELRVYRQQNGGGNPSPPRLVGTTRRGQPWTSERVSWRRLTRGGGWALYSGRLGPGARPTASSLDDARGFIDFSAMPAPPQRVRLLGTKELLP
ncbi:MAG: hypothetical protein JWL77_6818, partial [Chthonomonadaceae bacterium]|nr:hypothetical protein [Chthonomonadaceae bacterium]